MSRRRVRPGAAIAAASLGLLTACHPSITPPSFTKPDASLVTQAKLTPCPATGAPAPNGLPKVTLRCIGAGPKVDLAGLRGPAIVNAWYSACEPCQKEAGFLAQFAAKAGSKVLIIGVDSESKPDFGLEFVHDHNLHFAMLTDQHSDFAVASFPSTYFLDAHGNLVGAPLSPIASLQQLEDEVRTRLGVAVS